MPLETPLLALHKSAGAEIGEYFGTLLPARFGDFGAEYRAVQLLWQTRISGRSFLFPGPTGSAT
jgi:hypothetical protein